MTEPAWLKTAKGFIGTSEISGSNSNPTILEWPAAIASKFPKMNSYCALYTNDDIAWCGLFVGTCVALNDIEPVFGATDTDKFLWAEAWLQFGISLENPKLGAIMVLSRHVNFFDGDAGNGYYWGIGGNQSNSVTRGKYAYGDVKGTRWPKETVTKPAVPLVRSDQHRRMGAAILDAEARRDSAGRLAVYQLPSNDGGGTYEVAGINDRYHPKEAAYLATLIHQGKHAQAEAYAIDYILQYTDVAATWTADPGVEFYLRDCVFNRGPTGAARILQRALGVDEDGEVGPITLSASAATTPSILLAALRKARESYERDPVGRDESSNLWKGLVNRWNNAMTVAQKFSGEVPVVIFPPTGQPTMPPIIDQPSASTQVEECLAEMRPILEKYLQQQQNPDDVVMEIIRRLRPDLALPTPPGVSHTQTTSPVGTVAQPEPVPASGPPTNSIVAGILAALGVAGAQATGAIGTPFGLGEAPTTAGTLSTLASIAAIPLGMTGIWGQLGMGLLKGLASIIPQQGVKK